MEEWAIHIRYLQITGRDLSDWRNPSTGGWLLLGEGANILESY